MFSSLFHVYFEIELCLNQIEFAPRKMFANYSNRHRKFIHMHIYKKHSHIYMHTHQLIYSGASFRARFIVANANQYANVQQTNKQKYKISFQFVECRSFSVFESFTRSVARARQFDVRDMYRVEPMFLVDLFKYISDVRVHMCLPLFMCIAANL